MSQQTFDNNEDGFDKDLNLTEDKIKEDLDEVQINEIDYVSSTYINNQEQVYTIIHIGMLILIMDYLLRW